MGEGVSSSCGNPVREMVICQDVSPVGTPLAKGLPSVRIRHESPVREAEARTCVPGFNHVA